MSERSTKPPQEEDEEIYLLSETHQKTTKIKEIFLSNSEKN